MTIEQIAELIKTKYPIGTKIRVSNDIKKMETQANRIGWAWPTGKDTIAGQTFEIIRHDFGGIPSVNVPRPLEFRQGGVDDWAIHIDWIVEIVQDDPDLFLKQERDRLLSSIFCLKVNPDWLLQMAEKENGKIISAGGFFYGE